MELFSKLTIIIPTFYPGPIINNCIDSLPETANIIVVDNGEDEELQNLIKQKKHNITHYKIGDVGLPKSFNFAVNKSKNEDILITQPDVKFERNTLRELIKAKDKKKTPPNLPICSEFKFRSAAISITTTPKEARLNWLIK